LSLSSRETRWLMTKNSEASVHITRSNGQNRRR